MTGMFFMVAFVALCVFVNIYADLRDIRYYQSQAMARRRNES